MMLNENYSMHLLVYIQFPPDSYNIYNHSYIDLIITGSHLILPNPVDEVNLLDIEKL